MMKNQILIIFLLGVFVVGCTDSTVSRDAVILGAERILDGPDFPHQPGGAGSGTGNHHFYRGSFIVPFDDFRADVHPEADTATFLWDVFTSYGSFIRENIEFDTIPGFIAGGGSSTPEPNAHRYDYFFVSTGVSVIYDVEWFRGGPRFPSDTNPEVQVRYHIRIN